MCDMAAVSRVMAQIFQSGLECFFWGGRAGPPYGEFIRVSLYPD